MIAEAAARLVPRARATPADSTPGTEVKTGEEEQGTPTSVPDGADSLGEDPGPSGPSAHAPLTQTAPDEESEAE